MKGGWPKAHLHEAALAIHDACRANDTRLKVEWRPREDERMVEADQASRMFDKDDWGFSEKDFAAVRRWYGSELEFDLFASSSNARCANYAIKFAWEPALHDKVNCFSLDWARLGELWA